MEKVFIGLVNYCQKNILLDVLNYIHFADPLNEMGFFMATASMGPMLIYCGFAK